MSFIVVEVTGSLSETVGGIADISTTDLKHECITKIYKKNQKFTEWFYYIIYLIKQKLKNEQILIITWQRELENKNKNRWNM